MADDIPTPSINGTPAMPDSGGIIGALPGVVSAASFVNKINNQILGGKNYLSGVSTAGLVADIAAGKAPSIQRTLGAAREVLETAGVGETGGVLSTGVRALGAATSLPAQATAISGGAATLVVAAGVDGIVNREANARLLNAEGDVHQGLMPLSQVAHDLVKNKTVVSSLRESAWNFGHINGQTTLTRLEEGAEFTKGLSAALRDPAQSAAVKEAVINSLSNQGAPAEYSALFTNPDALDAYGQKLAQGKDLVASDKFSAAGRDEKAQMVEGYASDLKAQANAQLKPPPVPGIAAPAEQPALMARHKPYGPNRRGLNTAAFASAIPARVPESAPATTSLPNTQLALTKPRMMPLPTLG